MRPRHRVQSQLTGNRWLVLPSKSGTGSSSSEPGRTLGDRVGLALVIAVAWYCCAPAGAAEAATAVEIGTFENPAYVAVAPGEPSLLFVVERAGRIQILQDERPLGPRIDR